MKLLAIQTILRWPRSPDQERTRGPGVGAAYREMSARGLAMGLSCHKPGEAMSPVDCEKEREQVRPHRGPAVRLVQALHESGQVRCLERQRNLPHRKRS